jgi:hypothetical protein
LFQTIVIDAKSPAAAATATAAKADTKASAEPTAVTTTADDDSTIKAGTLIFGNSYERRVRDTPIARTKEELSARIEALRNILCVMHRLYVNVSASQ